MTIKERKLEEVQVSSSSTAIFLSDDVYTLIWSRLVSNATMTTIPGNLARTKARRLFALLNREHKKTAATTKTQLCWLFISLFIF